MNEVIHKNTVENFDLNNEIFHNALVQEIKLKDGTITKIVVLSNFQFSGMEAISTGVKNGLGDLHNVSKVRSLFGKIRTTGFIPSISTEWTDVIQKYK